MGWLTQMLGLEAGGPGEVRDCRPGGALDAQAGRGTSHRARRRAPLAGAASGHRPAAVAPRDVKHTTRFLPTRAVTPPCAPPLPFLLLPPEPEVTLRGPSAQRGIRAAVLQDLRSESAGCSSSMGVLEQALKVR